MKNIFNTIFKKYGTQKIIQNIIKYVILAIYILILGFFIENFGILGFWLWLLLTIILGVLIILLNWTAYKNIVDYGTMIIKYKQGWYDNGKNVRQNTNRKVKRKNK